MKDTIITIRDLTRTFGNFTAVNKINFDIHEGEILGFLGPNGAGKTTTIKMIIGLLNISSGIISLRGEDISKNRNKMKSIMGYMSQKSSLYPKLTPLENIEFFGGISGLKKKEILQKKTEISKLIPVEFLKIITEKLPPGIKQKIALFIALIPNPEIILLDEPTSGVDPDVRREFWFDIYNLKKSGKTILVSTHNLDEVEYTDRILILHRGNIIMEGKPNELKIKHNSKSIEELFKGAILKYEET